MACVWMQEGTSPSRHGSSSVHSGLRTDRRSFGTGGSLLCADRVLGRGRSTVGLRPASSHLMNTKNDVRLGRVLGLEARSERTPFESTEEGTTCD